MKRHFSLFLRHKICLCLRHESESIAFRAASMTVWSDEDEKRHAEGASAIASELTERGCILAKHKKGERQRAKDESEVKGTVDPLLQTVAMHTYYHVPPFDVF